MSLGLEEFARGELDLQGLDNWLRARASRMDQLDALNRLIVIDADGLIRFTMNPAAMGFDVSDREFFRQHRDDSTTGMTIGVPIISRIPPHNRIVPVSWAIRHANGRFAGTIAVVASWQSFAQSFTELTNDTDQIVALISATGQLVHP